MKHVIGYLDLLIGEKMRHASFPQDGEVNEIYTPNLRDPVPSQDR